MTKKLIRSVKLQTLSDAQIIKRYLDHPQDEELYFLTLEIELRGLHEQVNLGCKKKTKNSRHSVFYYLFYLFLFGMFLARFGSGLFNT